MRERVLGAGKQGIVAGLDIGTTKIACFVAKLAPSGLNGEPEARVLGVGHQVSRGLRKGTVVDIQAAEEAIRAAVDAAERMAGVVIQKVWITFSHASVGSIYSSALVPLPSREVGPVDVRRVVTDARARARLDQSYVLHAIPLGFSIDGAKGIAVPKGMVGSRLAVSMHFVHADLAPVRNLTVAVKRCHLEIAGFVASPYAAGLASLVADEMDLGVTLIDMGGAATSLGVFADGKLVMTDTIPVGGAHVTNDIARGLATPLSDAERLKTLYGSALPSPTDDRELIEVAQMGEDFDGVSNQVPRAHLTAIVQPRVEETLEIVRDRIARNGFEDVAGRRVVLTGGASQLTGVRELASRMLNKPVRAGRPIGLTGVPETVGGPAFAACAGLLAYSVRAPKEAPHSDKEEQGTGTFGQFSRIGEWLKANF